MNAQKVTLTLPGELLASIDRYVASHSGVTRSGICAEALLAWLQTRYDEEVEAYYQTQTEEERDEDRTWAQIAAASAARTWT